MSRASTLLLQGWRERVPASAVNRLVGASLALPGALVLGLARWLEPSPAGVGTHLQLGLNPCVMLVLTGIPCPMCGMTTTFAHMADGQLLGALANQPAGVVLFAITVVGTLVGLADMLLGRGIWRRVLAWIGPRETRVAIALLMVMGLGWIYKIFLLRGFLHPGS